MVGNKPDRTVRLPADPDGSSGSERLQPVIHGDKTDFRFVELLVIFLVPVLASSLETTCLAMVLDYDATAISIDAGIG